MRQIFNLRGALLALSIVFAAAPALAGGDHKPKHGGVVVETKAGNAQRRLKI